MVQEENDRLENANFQSENTINTKYVEKYINELKEKMDILKTKTYDGDYKADLEECLQTVQKINDHLYEIIALDPKSEVSLTNEIRKGNFKLLSQAIGSNAYTFFRRNMIDPTGSTYLYRLGVYNKIRKHNPYFEEFKHNLPTSEQASNLKSSRLTDKAYKHRIVLGGKKASKRTKKNRKQS